MAFRDDREALKNRAQELEAELASTEKELDAERANAQRARQLEAELVQARERLHAIERQLPKRRPAAPLVVVIACVASLVVLGAGAAMFLLISRPAPSTPPAVVVESPAVPPQETATPPAPPREVAARWKGRVKSATGGLSLPVGTSCETEAVLRSPQASDLRLTCGDTTLYRSSDTFSGTSHRSTNIGETPGPSKGTALLWLRWDDIGARSGARSQVSINTRERIAAAWKETEPSYRVEIEMEVLSEPASGALEPGHTEASLPFTERARAAGTITNVSGRSPVAAGAKCELTLAPAWEGSNGCRATVDCGEKRLYGDGVNGFSTCTVSGGRATAFTDDVHDGDPILLWDLEKGTAKLVVKGAEEWEADISATIQR